MASKAVNKFRIYCNTEAQYVYTWDDVVPTACPHNNAHSIDTDTISIIDTVQSAAIQVMQESGVTGGNYCCESGTMVIGTLTTQNTDISWPYPISVAGVQFMAGTQHVNDWVTSEVAPNTPIGIITQDITTGGTVLSVNSTVLQYGNIGTWISLTDGSAVQNLGRLLAIDTAANTITVETPATANMSASSPTYVLMTFRNVHIQVSEPGNYIFGSRSLRAAYIPANTIIRIIYNNETPSNDASLTFTWMVEFYY